MTILTDRLRKLIREKSIPSLARELSLSDSLLRKYVTGQSQPGIENAAKIAYATGVSLDWLAGRPGAARQYGDKHMIESVSAGIQEATGLIPVPLYEIEAGAGNTKLVESEDTETWLWISRAWAERYGQASLAIIKASGDSMLPAIEPGSLMLVNLADKTRDAGVRVVRMTDGLTVKRCDPRPRGALHMSSDNTAHEPFTAKDGDYEIVGVVVATIKVWE